MPSYADDAISVHREAFSQWPHEIPDEELAEFGQYFLDLADLTGFLCVAAIDIGPDSVVGFAFGWTSEPGIRWRDAVETALGPKVAHEWLTDSFEFALIATDPKLQGKGIGGRLHDALLHEVPHRRAVLSTLQEESPALRLFRNRGWQTLLSGVAFEEGGKPFLILGYQKSVAA